MKQLLFLLLILSAFLLTTCEKAGGHLYLTGQVYDPLTHQGIAGIKLRLYKSIGKGDDKTKLLDEATTDENGYYLLKHTGSPKIHFVEVDPQDYYVIGWTDELGSRNRRQVKGTHKNMDMQLLPYGYVKENVHNVNCPGSSEIMGYRRLNTDARLDEASETFYGCASEDGTAYRKLPMGWTHYEIMRTYGWDYDVLWDSVYVGAGEYVEHTIDY